MIGVIVSPRKTFAAIAADPRWAAVLTLVTLGAALTVGAVLTTDVGQQALLDQQVSTLESFGVAVSDERYAAMEAGLPNAAYTTAAAIAAGLPLGLLGIAGILFAIIKTPDGARPPFRQVVAIVVFSATVLLVQQLVMAPLNYARESLTSGTNLTVFLPNLEEGTFLARALGLIDFFYVWWLLVLSIGLSVVYRRPTMKLAGGLLAAYAAVAAGVGAILGAFGGS
jgi:hypothetical protein